MIERAEVVNSVRFRLGALLLLVLLSIAGYLAIKEYVPTTLRRTIHVEARISYGKETYDLTGDVMCGTASGGWFYPDFYRYFTVPAGWAQPLPDGTFALLRHNPEALCGQYYYRDLSVGPRPLDGYRAPLEWFDPNTDPQNLRLIFSSEHLGKNIPRLAGYRAELKDRQESRNRFNYHRKHSDEFARAFNRLDYWVQSLDARDWSAASGLIVVSLSDDFPEIALDLSQVEALPDDAAQARTDGLRCTSYGPGPYAAKLAESAYMRGSGPRNQLQTYHNFPYSFRFFPEETVPLSITGQVAKADVALTGTLKADWGPGSKSPKYVVLPDGAEIPALNGLMVPRPVDGKWLILNLHGAPFCQPIRPAPL